MTLRVFVPLTATALLLSTAATAQVTASDVWTNSNAPLVALGGTVNATPATDGATTTYTDYSVDFTLPFGSGTFTLGLPVTALTENGDGTVTMSLPEGFDMSLAGEITGEGSFSATLEGDAEEAARRESEHESRRETLQHAVNDAVRELAV